MYLIAVVINAIKDAEIVKTGVIKDIVLKELGDNIFVHGDGRNAHIIMTKFGSDLPEEAKEWKQITLKESTPFEKAFFTKLEGRPYLSLVISDKGDGMSSFSFIPQLGSVLFPTFFCAKL